MPKARRKRQRTTGFTPYASASQPGSRRYQGFKDFATRAPTNMRNIRIGGFLGIENKFVDYEVTSTALTTGPASGEKDPTTVNCLNAVEQGDGESQRDGRRYKMNSLHIRGDFQLSPLDGAGAQTPVVVRLAIVMDTQTNGAQMNAEDCFKTTTTAAQGVFAFRNLQFTGRFIVLYDKSYTINATAGAGNGTTNDFSKVIKQFKINMKIPEKYAIVDTNGTTANVSVITDNSIHLLAWVDNTGVTTNIRYESRLRFVG